MNNEFMPSANGRFDIVTVQDRPSIKKLPAGIYNIREDKESFFFHASNKEYIFPEFITDGMKSQVNFILGNLKGEDELGATGVLMSGDFGAGKTMAMEMVASSLMKQHQIPVVIVDSATSGHILLSMIMSIGPCVVTIDEFDRTYSEPKAMLSLLSFLSDSGLKDVTILATTNNPAKLPKSITNRPGRFLYHLRFKNETDKLALNMLEKKGIYNKEIVLGILVYIKTYAPSFDIVNTLVRCAVNSHDESEVFFDLIDCMNLPSFPINKNRMERKNNITVTDVNFDIESGELPRYMLHKFQKESGIDLEYSTIFKNFIIDDDEMTIKDFIVTKEAENVYDHSEVSFTLLWDDENVHDDERVAITVLVTGKLEPEMSMDASKQLKSYDDDSSSASAMMSRGFKFPSYDINSIYGAHMKSFHDIVAPDSDGDAIIRGDKLLTVE